MNFLLLAFAAILLFCGNAFALPKLQRVGVIPTRFEDDASEWKGMQKGKDTLNRAFYDSVRDSKRFRVLNDELVKQLWATPSGRKELATRHEMDAFVSLSASRRGDVVTLTTRLMSPEMKIYLQETENLDSSALENNEVESIGKSTHELVYRNFNRLPADVFVIATQGKYVTFAGGENQGIKVGDNYEVQKSVVESSHPANGSWLTFRSQKVGDVKIIEAKSQTAIGEISNEVSANSIQPGDGIRVSDIPTRSEFKQKAAVAASANQSDPIIVDPIYAKGMEPPKKPKPAPKEKEPEQVNDPGVKPGQKEKVDVPLVASKNEQQPAQPSQTAPASPQPAAEEPDDGKSILDISNITKNMAERYSIYAGLRTWKVSGPDFSYAAGMPIWIFNNGAVEFHKPLSVTAHLKYGLGLLLGSSYFGYELFAKPYYELVIDGLPRFVDRMRFGGYGKFEGKSTKDDQFGGYDMSKIGVSARVAGQISKQTLPEKLNWEAGFDMPILATGRVGYNGSMHNVNGYSGFNMHAEGVIESSEAINWGASLDYGTEVYKSEDRIQESTTKLMGIINMKW